MKDNKKTTYEQLSFVDKTMLDVKAFDMGIPKERIKEVYDEYFRNQPEKWM